MSGSRRSGSVRAGSQSRRRQDRDRTRADDRVTFVPDDDGRGGLTLWIDGVPSSHLDPDQPERLDFEYMRWIGDALDTLPAPGPLRIAHLGGAACTLPRYVAATRPGSRQIVLEIDAEVLDAVRRELRLRSTARLRLRHADGREGLATVADGTLDAVVRDAFAGDAVPEHLQTRGFLLEARRVLGPAGLYLANLADRPPLHRARAEAATALAVFGYVALIGEPAQFKGRRHGNLVLVASPTPPDDAGLVRRLASGAVRARYLDPAGVRGFAAGFAPLEDTGPPKGSKITPGTPTQEV